MTRIFLILIMFIQLSGCALLLETAGGSFIGTLGAKIVKDQYDKYKKDDDKKDEDKKVKPWIKTFINNYNKNKRENIKWVI